MLRTPRLLLEPISPAHAPGMFLGLCDPRLYEFISAEPPASIEALRQRYERLAKRTSPDGLEQWLNWILRPVDEPACLGYVQATVRAGGAGGAGREGAGAGGTADVAYVLFSCAQRRGLAREGVAAMIEHLRSSGTAHNFRATVHPANAPSIALLRALGFEHTSTRLNAELIRGVPTDEQEFWLRA